MFPGTGPNGNGMPVALKDQGQWFRYAKTDGCIHCHQIGDIATRTFPSISAISIRAPKPGSAACNPDKPAAT
jgi:hypothetical protein